MPIRKDLTGFTTVEALECKLREVRSDRPTVKKSATAASVMHRLEFDIVKAIGIIKAEQPDATATMTPYTSMSDDELGESFDVFVAHCPEHLITRLQSSIDRRRMGPALALVADEDPGE